MDYDDFMQDESHDESRKCRCGKVADERIYDDHGIYAGYWCSYDCADSRMNLHYTAQDAAECGECIEPEDYLNLGDAPIGAFLAEHW